MSFPPFSKGRQLVISSYSSKLLPLELTPIEKGVKCKNGSIGPPHHTLEGLDSPPPTHTHTHHRQSLYLPNMKKNNVITREQNVINQNIICNPMCLTISELSHHLLNSHVKLTHKPCEFCDQVQNWGN